MSLTYKMKMKVKVSVCKELWRIEVQLKAKKGDNITKNNIK